MAKLTVKRAPAVASNERAWSQVYDDINDIIKSVNKESTDENRTKGMDGLDGDIRLFKDNVKSKYFIEGKFKDGWAKRELLFSDSNDATQDESINFSATESYVKPDGSVPFTAVVSGVSPSADAHLATKAYVDTNVNAIQLTGNVTGGSGSVTISTTIATNAIAKSMMQDDSVGTDEILNSNVTYAKLQNVSATKKVLGRISSGSGVVEEITPTQLADIVSDADSSDGSNNLYLAASGLFREISAAVDIAGISDTVIQSLADNHFLYYDYNAVSDTGFWKNRLLVASDIPTIDISSKTTGTLPVNRGGTGATSGYNSSNWNTAYGWGDHGTAGYMSSFIITETDAGTNTVNNGKYVKFASSNSGSHGNSTVTGDGSSGDPFVVTLNTPDTDTNTNQLTTFTLTADSGSNQTIAHGNTLDIEGGTGVSTVVGSTDKVTVSIGQSIGTSNSPTFAGLTLSSLSEQASEATALMKNGSNVVGWRELGTAAFAGTGDFMAADSTPSFTSVTTSGNVDAAKVLANTSNTNYDLNVGTNGAGIYGTMYMFDSGFYSYHTSTNSYLQFQNTSNVGYLRMSASGGAGASYKGLTIDAGGTGNDSGRVKIDTQLGVNITSTTNWSTTSDAKLVVGKILSNASSAAAQIHGGIRCTSFVVMHEASTLANSVYWQYGNGGLQTGKEGSGTENVYVGGDVTAYYSSDPRLKKNKKKLKNPLKILDKINGYTFDWKNYAKNVGTHLVGSDYGVMADEIEEVMPELVHDRDNGYKGVKYEKIVPLLIECIKEQQVQINQLRKWKEDKKWI